MSAIFSNAGGNVGSPVALVTVPGQGPLLVPGVPSYNSNTGAGKYVGSVVLDRGLVKPGDSLHITGEPCCGRRALGSVSSAQCKRSAQCTVQAHQGVLHQSMKVSAQQAEKMQHGDNDVKAVPLRLLWHPYDLCNTSCHTWYAHHVDLT
jgi:hypothetical protein